MANNFEKPRDFHGLGVTRSKAAVSAGILTEVREHGGTGWGENNEVSQKGVN